MTLEMNFGEMVKELKLEKFKDSLSVDYEKSAAFEKDARGFLSETFVKECSSAGCLNGDFSARLLEVAAEIRESQALLRYFAHWHYLLFVRKADPPEFPDAQALMGDRAGPAFTALLVFSGFPSGRAHFGSMNIPDDIAAGTFRDMSLWMEHFKKTKNFIGVTPRILGWERGLLRGSLYRVGRLQFGVRVFGGRIYVFKNKHTGAVLTLLTEGQSFTPGGLHDGVDNIHCPAPWTSVFVRESRSVTGNPVSPEGFAINKPVTISLDDWAEVLAPEDSVIDIHIPEDGPMTVELCADAVNRSAEFFTRYFPDRPFKGWKCSSWFLDPQLPGILPATSNIVKFQRIFHLFPIKEGGSESLWRIFGEDGLKNGLANAPRVTSMQKAVAAFLEKGGSMRAGGAFFLKSELPFGRMLR